ncbi:unnamed protein product [Sphenostylis stenocarpa]|uniref:Uncharacterized protein n=1 Tax=Sphenostylis stenocarpa TaxID=92480 RepID=A0AA86SMR6_9FABA|nr:unnamed protein product [Sphenostylis stenocarpa]
MSYFCWPNTSGGGEKSSGGTENKSMCESCVKLPFRLFLRLSSCLWGCAKCCVSFSQRCFKCSCCLVKTVGAVAV